MANLEEELRIHTLNQSAIQTVFGARFHWNRIPEEPVYPYIHAVTITDNPIYHQQGNGLGKTLVQMAVVAPDKEQCNQATDVLFQVFDGYRGAMGEFRVRTMIRNVPSSWEPDPRYFRRIVEVEIGYAH